MPIADWLPYSPPLYINIGFGLSVTSNPQVSVKLLYKESVFYLEFKGNNFWLGLHCPAGVP